jgi:hypothetical protein
MRRKKLVLAVVVVLAVAIAAAAAGPLAARQLPSSTRYPRLRRIAQFFFPPTDLHEPLVETPANVSMEGMAVEFDFVHRYPGLHSLDLDVPVEVPTGVIPPGTDALVLSVSCKDSSGHELSERTKGGVPYWGRGHWGISILTYGVPDQFSFGDRIHCRVTPVSGGSVFARESPRHQFVVTKASEE